MGFGASGVGFGAAMWGSEPLMWGSEVSFANNGVQRSEMWGSWPLSPPTLLVQKESAIILKSTAKQQPTNKIARTHDKL